MIREMIIALREGRGWTQTQLANRLNMSPKAIKNWETGTAEPNIESIRALAKVFNVSTDYLLEMTIQESIVLDDLNRHDKQVMRSLFSTLLELNRRSE